MSFCPQKLGCVLVFSFALHSCGWEKLQAGTNLLPEGAIAGFGQAPFQSASSIVAAELSPDGRLLATLGERSLTVWDTASGQQRHRFFFPVPSPPRYRFILVDPPLHWYARGLAFSPDGKRLACRPTNNLIVVWDLTSGKEERRFILEAEQWPHFFLRFSADGKTLIAQIQKDLVWLNVATGGRDRVLSDVWIGDLSSDNRTFAVAEVETGQVRIGDAKTGKIAHSLPIAAIRRQDGILFLRDGVTLAAVHRPDKLTHEVQFWDVATGKRTELSWKLPGIEDGNWYLLMLSPDGRLLFASKGYDNKNILVYSVSSGEALPPITLDDIWTTRLVPHPDSKTLFAFHHGAIRRWDVFTRKEISKVQDFLNWHETILSRNMRWAARKAYQGPVELWDLESGKAKRVHYDRSNALTLAFSPDSKTLAVNRYDHIEFLRVSGLTKFETLIPENGHIREASLQFSPDGRFLALLDRSLRIFDLETKQVIWSREKLAKVLFTPDGKKILTIPNDERVLRLHEFPAGKVHYEVPQPQDRDPSLLAGHGQVSALTFSPDIRCLALAKSTGDTCLLDAATGKERSRFLSMTTEVGRLEEFYLHATALAFSPDGQWLAVGGHDGFLRIWEVSTSREVHRLFGHEGLTQAISFSTDGRRLVSFDNSEGFLWDLRPRQNDKKAGEPFEDLLSPDGPTVYRAIWKLIDDPQAPARLRARIAPRKLDLPPERMARLIGDLESKEFKVRDGAMRALEQLDGAARPALLAALEKQPELETERRLRLLLEKLNREPTAEELRVSRAIQVLELQGSEAARQVLREWSEGTPGLRLTEEARAALARLSR